MIIIINYEGEEEIVNDTPVTTLDEDVKKEDDELIRQHIIHEEPLLESSTCQRNQWFAS